MAAALFGAAFSVSDTVSVLPLRCALVPSTSMPEQLSSRAPSASNTSPARSVAEWSLVGQLDCSPIVCPLYTLDPLSWRENRLRVKLRLLLSSAQTTFAAPRWSTSTVKKSSRLRLPSHAVPLVQIWPMWFGRSEICTLRKSGPGFRAFCDCAKYTFQTDGFGLQPGSPSVHSFPFASTKPAFGLRPVFDL